MNNIRFSIVTPVYNREDCVSRCINSVLDQDHHNFEMIVVNDGSTDESLHEINALRAKSNSLKIITYKDNRGVNFARNRGIEMATGDFILFLDSDDYFLADALSKITKTISAYSNYTHFLFLNDDSRADRDYPQDIEEFYYEDWLEGKISGDFVHIVKSDVLKNNLFYEDFRSFEVLNWLRIFRANGKQLFIPEYITRVELNRPDSLSLESLLDNRRGMIDTFNFIVQFSVLFSPDFQRYNKLTQLEVRIKKGILLGIALRENYETSTLIGYLSNPIERRFFNLMNKPVLHLVFYKIIQSKSLYNQLKKRL